jgi:hypothetical protein
MVVMKVELFYFHSQPSAVELNLPSRICLSVRRILVTDFGIIS